MSATDSAVRVPARESRRRIRRAEQADRRRQRRLQRGQTLVIFALTITMLLGLAGLAIDVARAFDLYARMVRAAEAGVLAGVLYMPTFYDQPTPAGIGTSPESAVSRASEEIVKNGLGSVLPNNVSDCPSPVTSVEVAICQVPGKVNDLKVTITETLSITLLSGLGVQPVTLSASAQSEYLPSVQLGARLNYFGDQVECYLNSGLPNPTATTHCNTGDNSKTHLQNFLATIKGPQTLKEFGDPMVYCEEGSAASPGPETSPGAYTTYNGVRTNHPQWSTTRAVIQQHCGLPVSGGNAGNPDFQPSGFDGPATAGTAHEGGYNYEIVVPPGITTTTVWVFNPSFIPNDTLSDPSGDGNSGFDYINPSGKDPFGNGVTYNGRHVDAPPFFFDMTYTLYQVQSLYDRTADVETDSTVFPAYDGYSADTSLHGCTGTRPAYDPYWSGQDTGNSYYAGTFTSGDGKGCFDLATNTAPPWETRPKVGKPCFMMWCQITTSALQPNSTYRLVVEATGQTVNDPRVSYTSTTTDGAGSHSYAVKVCTNATVTPISCSGGASGGNPGVTIFGWNNMEMDVTSPLARLTPNASNPSTTCASGTLDLNYTCVDLGCIPTAYAGRLVNVQLFDPGDGNGNIYIGVVPPSGSGATVTYTASWIATTPGYLQTHDGDQVVHAGFGSYNALNGQWLEATLTLPSSYTGNCLAGAGGTGWWQLIYATDNSAQPFDWLNVQFSIVGSPIHLVPPQ
ncbi:MAG TPA: Tad domain-containing protein, partial [Ktedonobacterales bacterium]|nr:Tad domain-containing protein [Ktedonobacterales bacterium]